MKVNERLISFCCPICKMKCKSSVFVIKEHLIKNHPNEKVVMNKKGIFEKLKNREQ
jgi:hypothetical protein